MLLKSASWLQSLKNQLKTRRGHRGRVHRKQDVVTQRQVATEQLESRALLTTLVNQNFDAFGGMGFQPSPAADQLDSDEWRVTGMSQGDSDFGASSTSGDFARGSNTGGVGTGGVYGFTVGTGDNVLGVQPTGSDFTPGTFTLRVENTTGDSVTAFDVNYDIAYLNDQARANSFNFSFSTDDTTYTNVGALDFTSPAASDSDGWQSEARSTTINATVAAGGFLYLQWSSSDVSGGGSRDELVLNNLVVETSGGSDSTAPTASTFSPADGATDVAVDTDLVVTFDEGVQAGTGNITIHLASDQSIVQTIDVTGGDVDISGSVLTINPADLAASTAYYVNIPATAIDDLAGNDFAGITDTTTWNFTTEAADTTAPTVTALSPADDATDVPIESVLVATFDEEIQAGTGDITVRLASDDSVVQTFDVTGDAVTIDGAELTVDLADLALNTAYYVLIPAGAVEDTSGNDFAGFTAASDWNFTTTDGSSPNFQVTEAFPGVSGPDGTAEWFEITNYGTVTGNINTLFYEDDSDEAASAVQLPSFDLPGGESVIVLNTTDPADIAVFESIWGVGPNIVVFPTFAGPGMSDGGDDVNLYDGNSAGATLIETVTFDGSADDETYEFDGSGTQSLSVVGVNGAYASALFENSTIGDANDMVFLVGSPDDQAAPIVTDLFPADDEATASSSDDLAVTFNENVIAGSGNITIHLVSDGTTVETLDVSGGQVSFSGSEVTIDPVNDLTPGTAYYVNMPATAITDLAGNQFGGISDTTTWNFTVAAGAEIQVEGLGSIIDDGDNTPSTTDDTDFGSVLTDTGSDTHTFTVRNVGGEALDVSAITVSAGDTADFTITNFTAGTVAAGAQLTFDVVFDPTSDGQKTATISIANDDNNENPYTFDVTGNGFTLPSIAITEFINDVSGAETDDEWFELYNYGATAIDLTGFTFSDEGSNSFTLDAVTIAAGDYIILASNKGNFETQWLGGTADPRVVDYNGMTLGNSDDEIIIRDTAGNTVYNVAWENDETAGQATYLTDGSFTRRDWGNDNGPTIVRSGDDLGVAGLTGYEGTAEETGSVTSTAGDKGTPFAVHFTNDNTPPSIVSLSPADDSVDNDVSSNLVVTFNETILAGTGNIVITDATDGSSNVTIPMDDAQVTVAGRTLTIDLTANLEGATAYHVQIDTGAITDATGNDFAGITDATTWNFETEVPDVTAPTVASFSPADDSVDVAISTDLVITFDEDIQKGSGDIVIRLTSDDSLVQTIDVASADVTVAGAVVTIDPADLANGTDYYVEVATTAFEDLAGNNFAGITTKTTWNFVTSTLPVFAITATDASKDEGNSGTTPFTFTITRSGNTSGAVDIDFAVTGSGTSMADATDFDGGTLPGGTVSFADGETTQTVTINVAGDTDFEADEEFTVTISNPSVTANISGSTATGTIQNDDAIPVIITEIMYNPLSDDGSWEWVEVYNTTTAPIDLAGWVIDDDDGSELTNANIAGGTVPAGGTAVLFNDDAIDASDFTAAWGTGINLIGVTDWSGLSNGGDSLGLWDSLADYTGDQDNQAKAIVALDYDDGSPWPTGDREASIFLTDLSADFTVGSNWLLSTDGAATPAGGSAYVSLAESGNSGEDIGSPGGFIPTLTAVISADQISEAAGADAATVTITRTGDLTQPLTVTLTTDDASEASVPTTVTIAANAASAVVDIDAIDDAVLDGTQTVTITASASGFRGGSDTLDVEDDEFLASELLLNEIMFDPNDSDAGNEYIELRGTADGFLPADAHLALIEGDAGNQGQLRDLISLDGLRFGSNGYLTILQTGNSFTVDPAATTSTASFNLENGSFSVLLIQAATTPTVSTDYDSADNGTLDNGAELWTVVDGYGNISGGSEDTGYGPIVTSGNGSGRAAVSIINLMGYHPDYAGRNGDSTGSTQADWVFAEVAGAAPNYTLATDPDFVAPGQFAGAPLDHIGSTNAWNPPTILTVDIVLDSLSENGGTTGVTITRAAADISSALSVTLTTDDTELNVPATVTIPADQISASFSINGLNDALVDGDQTVTLTAAAAGFTDGSDTVIVEDVDVPELALTLSTGTIAEDETATLTISRNTIPTGALVINLSSDDTTEATVPASVEIPAGQMSVDVIITGQLDGIVDGTQTAIITATATGHADDTAAIDVTNIDVNTLSVTITPDSISEQDGVATGTVTRNTDTTDALTVNLTGSDSTEAQVPAFVVIPAGEASADFTITAVDDALNDGTQTVTVTAATAGFIDGTDTLDVLDNDDARFVLNITGDSIAENGGTTMATVHRNTDTSVALVVTLTSDDTTEASVPATVTIPVGAAFVQFAVSAVDDNLVDGTQTATITASAAGFLEDSDSVDVTDDDSAVLTLTIDPASISENGGTATGTVTRNTDTSTELIVTLASDDTTEATVPATVTIPAGQASADFPITGVDDSIQDGTQTVTISVSATDFASDSDTVDVEDDDAAVLTVSITADSISENGGTSTATVTRNSDTTNALEVTLTSDDTSEATVPTSVTIPAGQASVTFDVSGVDDAIVDGTQTATITASATGFTSGDDTVDVTDDDTATLTVVIDSDSISENGGTSTATVSRNTDTTDALEVTLSSSDTSEATVPMTVTIPAGQTSVTFDVTGVDDAIVDGTQTATITASAATFTDGTDTVDATDDDSPTLTLVIDADAIAEDGGSTTATVSRNTETSVALVVNLVSDDTTEATVPATVTIPVGQTSIDFTINAVDDSIVDGTQPATITASAATFTDASDSVDVTDNDTGTLTVSIDSDSISENEGTSSVTVSRNTGTAGDLVVTLSSDDTSEATVPATVTIPDGQTSATFTVTGVDDLIVDGTQVVAISATATDFTGGSDTVDVEDDDIGTLTVVIDPDSISEAGGIATGTVSRNTATDQSLTVTLASSDTSEIVVAGSVVIPAGQTSATFTVPAVDDSIVDGTQTATVTATAGGFVAGSDTIDVTDDDVATLSLTIAADSISENGGSTTATVSRNTDTSNDLVVTLASDDTGEATVPDTVTIPAGQTSATFDVTGVDDALLDGTQTATITATVSGFVSASDSLDVTDDDAAGFTVTESDGNTAVSEDGTTDTLTVVLTSAPASPVTFNVTSDDNSEAVVDSATLTFDATNWSTPQTVTVTGVDDALLDGTQTSVITISVDDANSDDNFDGLADQTVSVETTDNDKATASIVTTANGEEAGPTNGNFRISLSEAAPADVVVNYTVGGNAMADADYVALTGAITIPAGTTMVDLPVSVLDDNNDEVTERVIVTLSAGDTLVSATEDSAEVLILDNDVSAIVSSRTSLSVNESGSSETFEVTLSSKPAADVTLEVAVSDSTEVSVDKMTLTFTPDNWNVAQTVTATGVDDADIDGAVDSTITLTTAAGSPGNFDFADPVVIDVTTADNESAGGASLNTVIFYNKDAEAEKNFSHDGTGQRSMVRRVQVVLDGTATITSAAGFSARNTTTNQAVGLSFVSSSIEANQTVIVLEFTSGLDAGTGDVSLADGRYELIVDGGAAGFDANGSGSAGGTATFNFHRMFGDSDGDQDVDGLDLGAYRQAIRGAAVLDALFDYDDDNNLFRDLDDLRAFRARYGRRL